MSISNNCLSSLVPVSQESGSLLMDTINSINNNKNFSLKSDLGITDEKALIVWLQSLGKYKQALVCLNLSNFKVIDGVIAELPASLKELHCHGYDGYSLTDARVNEIFTRCPNLFELHLSMRNSSADLFDRLPGSLQKLSVTASGINDEALCKLSTRCPDLQDLDVGYNSRIFGTSFGHLPPGLKVLTCQKCSLTDSAIVQLVARCRALQELNIAANRAITQSCVDSLPANIKTTFYQVTLL
jgi:hypothetical protein